MPSVRRRFAVVTSEPLEPRHMLHGDDATPHTEWLINAGGPATGTTLKLNFDADTNYTGGIAASGNLAIANTSNDDLYASRRYGKDFSYDLPVENGTYSLTLYFAEPYWTKAGQRKFDVFAEGHQLLNDYDIVATVGPKAALTKTFSVVVTDGALDLSFSAVVDNAIVSAIQAKLTAPATDPNPQPPVGTISWATKADAPFKFAEASAAAVNGLLYTLGGYDRTSPNWEATSKVSRYDPTTNTWIARAPMLARLTHMGVTSDSRYIYTAGGYLTNPNGLQTFATTGVYRYDTQTDTWSTLPSLPWARGAGAMTIVGRKLYFFGGVNVDRVDVPNLLSLNLDNLVAGWKSLKSMPGLKDHLAGVTLAGKMYAIGGQIGTDDNTGNQSSVYRYDPATNVWSQVASLPKVRSHIGGSTFVHDGRIIVTGGISANGVYLSDVTAYDPASDTWTALTPMPAARHSAIGASIGGKIYIVGGYLTDLSKQTWVGTVD